MSDKITNISDLLKKGKDKKFIDTSFLYENTNDRSVVMPSSLSKIDPKKDVNAPNNLLISSDRHSHDQRETPISIEVDLSTKIDQSPTLNASSSSKSSGGNNTLDLKPRGDIPVDTLPLHQTSLDDKPLDKNTPGELPLDLEPRDIIPLNDLSRGNSTLDLEPRGETPRDVPPLHQIPLDNKPLDKTPRVNSSGVKMKDLNNSHTMFYLFLKKTYSLESNHKRALILILERTNMGKNSSIGISRRDFESCAKIQSKYIVGVWRDLEKMKLIQCEKRKDEFNRDSNYFSFIGNLMEN